MSFTVFRESKAILGESLVWDEANNAMLWCDITAGLIHRSPIGAPTDGSGDTIVSVPPPVGSFHLAGEGGFIASLDDSIVLLDASGRVTRELARIIHAHPGMRLDEGKVDPAGRWATGLMDLTTGNPDGAFYSLSPDGVLRTLLGGIGVDNGLEWSHNGSHIWFTDTSSGTIYTGAYSSDGEISVVTSWHSGAPHDGLTARGHRTAGAEPHGCRAEAVQLNSSIVIAALTSAR